MRSPFRRRAPVPAEVRDRAALGGERVLAHAEATDGTWLLGTRDALVVVDPVETRRVPWEQVASADWDREEERLRVVEVGDYGQQQPVHTHGLTDPAQLLQLVRERVTASVVLQRRVTVDGRRGLSVVARRAPRGTGEIRWGWELDPGVDPGDPAVSSLAEAALAAAREELGLGREPI